MSLTKIKDIKELNEIIVKDNQKIVFTNGCFDVLHVGHTRLLNKAKSFGDLLIVGLNSDKSIKKIKGPDRPINNEDDRAEILSNLGCVDYIILFDEATPINLINFIKPNILVKGADYNISDVVGGNEVISNGGEVKLINLVEGKSTTSIINKLRGEKVLVTGGAGFIGSNLALKLEQQGYDVTIADNLFSGTKDNLNNFKGDFVNWDCSEKKNFDKKFNVIFHLAAITDPRHDDDSETYQKNVDGFKNIIELAKINNAKLIYASTANLYGNGPIPMKEYQNKEIITAYGKSKLKMDDMASELFDSMHIVGLRYFNVFGPRESHKGRPASMIYHLYQTMRFGRVPQLFKWGEQVRDHIYVKDVVRASMLALNTSSGIYNVGTGVGTSFKELISILNQVLNTSLEIEYFDMPYNPNTYQANTQADTELSKEKLKFQAAFSVEEGIKDYIKWLENEKK